MIAKQNSTLNRMDLTAVKLQMKIQFQLDFVRMAFHMSVQ